jgi:hypothetical protein
MLFWQSDLVVWPCCSGKDGASSGRPPHRIVDLLSPTAANLLRRGRRDAFRCLNNELDRSSELVPALDRYNGHLYKVPEFRPFVEDLLVDRSHALIESAGLGFVHPYELIHDYDASMNDSDTAAVWREILPYVLADYITRHHISRIFLAVSGKYDQVLVAAGRGQIWARHVDEVFRYIPHIGPGEGSPYEEAPKRIARELLRLQDVRTPSADWIRGVGRRT